MSSWLVVILLPIAAWSGWWLAMRKEVRDLRLSKSREAYFEGLSFLLGDQTDQAVDVFLSMDEIDHQTFDNQLTLGTLFRRRGELDRALHLHRQLADNPNLSEQQFNAVNYELAEDYIKAGMYEQSLESYANLAETTYRHKEVLTALLRIYEITENWQEGIKIAKKWESDGYGEKNLEIAQYYCEISYLMIKDKKLFEAKQCLDKALEHDSKCGRAHWMLGHLSEIKEEYVAAIHSYQSVAEQAVPFIPDILAKLENAYLKIERLDEYENWLLKTEETYPTARMTIATVEFLNRMEKHGAARALIEKRIEKFHSPLLLSEYIANRDDGLNKQVFVQIEKGIQPKTAYQCNECGFRQQRIIWHCPSCHAWSSFRPLLELKVEQR